MAFLELIRRLLKHKYLLFCVFLVAVGAAILSAYSVSSRGLEKRSLSVSAASSQILVDSVPSALAQGAETSTFEALATRAKIYGQYLASLSARTEIARRAGVPATSLSTSGPFSTATGQVNYSSESSGERASELLQEGAGNRLVFSAQEGVPIITVDAQAVNTDTAVALASASYATLRRYIKAFEVEGVPLRHGVTVRQLGEPEGGTLGGSNDKMLMALAFLLTFGLGCAVILAIPTVIQRWRTLGEADADRARAADGPAYESIRSVDDPRHGTDELILPAYQVFSEQRGHDRKDQRGHDRKKGERRDPDETKPPVTGQPATTG
ncbi:MAG TPA: hypothetical protein VH299_10505 [Solirubrobacterales bacterium]|jgi:hypothetical protein|nr:hypothetical protein [Solirubrobacterales bacterium]